MKEEKEKESIDPEKSAKADDGVKVPEKFKKIVKEIEGMSVLDLAELVKILEEKFGVSAIAPVVSPAAAISTGPVQETPTPSEQKTTFNVDLVSAGEQKIAVIKIVKEITGKGLKEAKDLVEAVPKIIKEGAKKEEAEEIKKKLEEVGAKVTLK